MVGSIFRRTGIIFCFYSLFYGVLLSFLIVIRFFYLIGLSALNNNNHNDSVFVFKFVDFVIASNAIYKITPENFKRFLQQL